MSVHHGFGSTPAPFKELFKDIDQFFINPHSLFDEMSKLQTHHDRQGYPKYDIIKRTVPNDGAKLTNEEQYEIVVALAGLSKDDVQVSVDAKGILMISDMAEIHENGTESTKGPREKDTDVYIVKNIAQRRFVRTFKLGENLQVGDITMKDGLLRIVLNVNRRTPDIKYLDIK